MTPAPDAPSTQSVLIISASMGGGHDGAAREIANRLDQRGIPSDIVDYLDLLPLGLGRAMKWIYALQLRALPASYGAVYTGIESHRTVLRLVRWFATLANPRLTRITRDCSAVISTYPLAGQALGNLRRKGHLTAPLVMYLTDFSVHPLWVVDDADLHVVLHAVTAAQVWNLNGSARVSVAGALVDDAFLAPAVDSVERVVTRVEFGIPVDAVVALVVAGSWGVGDVVDTAVDIQRTGRLFPVVACGRNDELRRRLTDRGIGLAIGWTDDMPRLVSASDLMIQNAGGLSSLEAFAAGLPVISMRCLPGHGHANADAMHDAGVALHACRMDSLSAALEALDTQAQIDAGRAMFRTDPADAIHHQVARGLESRTPATFQPLPRPLVAARRRALVGVAATVALVLGGTAGTAAAATHGVGVAHPTIAQSHADVFIVVLDADGKQLDVSTATPPADSLAVSPQEAAASSTTAGTLVLTSPTDTPPRGVATDPRGRPMVLLSRHPNAVALLRARFDDSTGVVPGAVVTSASQLPAVHGGEVIVVDEGRLGDAATSSVLKALSQQAHSQSLTPRPLSTLGRAGQ